MHLAVDTGIIKEEDIIVTGDCNYNTMYPGTLCKITDIYQQFALKQLSIPKLILYLRSNANRTGTSGVAESFLEQDVLYHCFEPKT